MNRRDFSAHLMGMGLSTGVLGVAAPSFAQGTAPAPVEGTQYTRIQTPLATGAGAKIEVLEFFSYACPHCSVFEPSLEAWGKKLPADVAFRRVPAPFLANAENFQRTYYALEVMGLLDTVHRKIFTAVHVERLHLDKPDDIANLVAKNGVDRAKFLSTFNSFSVAASLGKGKNLAVSYKLESVPLLAIQGRYLTSPSTAGGTEQALAVADYLIQRVRKGA